MEGVILSNWVRMCFEGFVQAGAPADALLAGMRPTDWVSRPLMPVSVMQVNRLFEQAARLLPGQSLPHCAVSRLDLTTYHALGYALMAAPTLLDAGRIICRYDMALSNVVRLRLQEVPEGYALIIRIPDRHTLHPLIPATCLSLAIRTLRVLSAGQASPLRVTTRASCSAPYHAWADRLECPVVWGSSEHAVYVDAASMHRWRPGGDPALMVDSLRLCDRYFRTLGRQRTADRLAVVLRDRLGSDPGLDQAAEALGMSPRTLQHHLSREGLCYRDVLDEVRREQALHLICHTDASVTDIALSLGFAEPANFTRAFRRWYQCAPTDYRQATRHVRSHRQQTVAATLPADPD